MLESMKMYSVLIDFERVNIEEVINGIYDFDSRTQNWYGRRSSYASNEPEMGTISRSSPENVSIPSDRQKYLLRRMKNNIDP